MGNKPKIVCFIDWFLPGFNAGGQIQSLANAIQCLHSTVDFFVVCRNTDLDGKQEYNLPTEAWIEKYYAKTFYIQGNSTYNKIKSIIEEVNPDFIYFSSFFSYQYTVLPLLYLKKIPHSAQIIVGPRGMLGKGALALKPTKKRLFISVAKVIGLYRSVIWHASTELEKDDIIAVFGTNAKIRVASDIPQQMPNLQYHKPTKTNIDSQFCFLSRISIKKNLAFVLSQLKDIASLAHLDIVGPIEDLAYWNDCQLIIDSLPSNITVKYHGSLPAKDIVNYLSQNTHFFILPTLHENFGHVIIEALSAGCPVLISDQTPWRQLETKNIGWDIPLSRVDEWTKVIQKCCEMNNDEYLKKSAAAQEFAASFCSNPEIIEANKKLFER